jgi:hypothetical protein
MAARGIMARDTNYAASCAKILITQFSASFKTCSEIMRPSNSVIIVRVHCTTTNHALDPLRRHPPGWAQCTGSMEAEEFGATFHIHFKPPCTYCRRTVYMDRPHVRTYVARFERPNRGPGCRALALLCMGAHMSVGLPALGLVCSRRVPLPFSLARNEYNTAQSPGCGRRKRGRRRPGAGAGASGGDPAFFGGVEWSGGAVAVEGSRGFWLGSVG